MKVILLSKIKGLGEIGDVKNVANGYGRNFLMPKKLAMPYSEEAFKTFEEKRASIQAENDKKYAAAMENKAKIEKIDIVILESAGENAKLYGSITSIRLANIINDLVKEKIVEKSNIIINNPIKEIGQFEFTVSLHSDVVFNKTLIVARSVEEAKKIKDGLFAIEKDSKSKKEEVKEDKKEEVKKEK